MMPTISRTPHAASINTYVWTFGAAILSGILMGLSFPPVSWKLLAWIGFVPFLIAMHHTPHKKWAFSLGLTSGFIFFLIVLYPLVSASSWSGWAQSSRDAFNSRMSQQAVFLHGVWLLFGVWGSLFWGTWAIAFLKLGKTKPWPSLVMGVSLWIVICEWLRAKTTFGFTWAFLGYTASALPSIRHIASVGGVLLLSALIMAVNIIIAQIICQRRHKTWWQPALSISILMGLICIIGLFQKPNTISKSLPVAVIQHYKDVYKHADFTQTGLDRHYLPMVERALKDQAKLIVLPESIQLGALRLDGTHSTDRPQYRQIDLKDWEDQLSKLLGDSDATLIVGLDTIENGKEFNTMVAWTKRGVVGWYHKRRLVPFAEYWPSGWWRAFGVPGRKQYGAGHGTQLITIGGLTIGAFICQEVLTPHVTRESVRDGATILVTGGNDGVFGNKAVAALHADAAQIRAVETGRYIIRSMKTGISAIIDPTGHELRRSFWKHDIILEDMVAPLTHQTFYVRFGDWVPLVSLALIFLGVVWRRVKSK